MDGTRVSRQQTRATPAQGISVEWTIIPLRCRQKPITDELMSASNLERNSGFTIWSLRSVTKNESSSLSVWREIINFQPN